MRVAPSLAHMVFALACATAAFAQDQDLHVDLPCWAPYVLTNGVTQFGLLPPTNRSTGINWADPVVDQTVAGSGTATQSHGHEFPYDSVEEIHCAIILPSDYNTTGNVPRVTIQGWGIEHATCQSGDPQGWNLAFDVSSRSYAAGEMAQANWSTPTEGEVVLSCAFPHADHVRSVTIDAAASASSWSADELVFIRIRRLSDEDGYPELFHVARVRLRLPR